MNRVGPASRVHGDAQANDLLTPESARFLAAHLPWFEVAFADPESRYRTVLLIRDAARGS